MALSETEVQALLREGENIDQGAQEHADAAANGQLDDKGQIIAGPSPDQLLADKAAQWFILPKTLAWAITTVFPETASAYTDDKCLELAKAIVPVADKYGLDGIEASPELMLGIGTIAFCVPGYMAYKARQARAAQKAAAGPGAQETAQAGATDGG